MALRKAMVGVGGDSRVIGNIQYNRHNIAVRHPQDPEAMLYVLPFLDSSVSTAGDYQRYYEQDNVNYHHVIDLTVSGSGDRVQSVTIIGPGAVETDALSSACLY